MPQRFNGEVPPENMLFKHLRNSVGAFDMKVDGSGTPVEYDYTAPLTGYRVIINEMLVQIMDGAITMDKFGGIAALTTGLEIGIYDASDVLIVDPLDTHIIQQNGDWTVLAGVETQVKAGTTDDLFSVDWPLKFTGRSMWLKPGYTFRATVNDDLTALSEFHITLHGLIITE